MSYDGKSWQPVVYNIEVVIKSKDGEKVIPISPSVTNLSNVLQCWINDFLFKKDIEITFRHPCSRQLSIF